MGGRPGLEPGLARRGRTLPFAVPGDGCLGPSPLLPAPQTHRSPHRRAPGRQARAAVQGSQLFKTLPWAVREAIGGLLAFGGSLPLRDCPGCRWGAGTSQVCVVMAGDLSPRLTQIPGGSFPRQFTLESQR